MATGTKIDSFYASFGADFKELLSEFKKAERETGKFRSSMSKELNAAQQTIERFASTARKAVLGIVGAFSLAKIASMTKEGLRWADALEDQAQWLGVGVERLQEWQFAARQSGIDGEKLGAALEKMRSNLAEAASDPNSSGAQLFRSLRISITDAQGKLKGLEAQIPTLADAVARMQGGDKLNLAKALFGERNVGMIRFLEGGSAALQAFAQQGREAGQVLEREIIARNAALNKQYTAMTTAIDLDVKRALTDLGPVLLWLTGLAGGLAKVVSNIGRDTNISDLERRIEIHKEQLQKGLPGVKMDDDLRAAITAKLREAEGRRDAMAETKVAESYGDIWGVAARYGDQGRPKPTGGAAAGQAETFRKLMEDLRAKTAAAQAALDPYRAAVADLDGKLAKLTATDKQSAQAHAEFKKEWDAAGAKALAEYGAQSDYLVKVAAAETAGRRDLVAVLELEFALRQKFGAAFVEQNRGAIESTARARYQIEESRRMNAQMFDDIASAGRDTFNELRGALTNFGDENVSVAERVRQAWFNVVNRLMDKFLELAVLNPLLNMIPGQSNPTLGGFLGNILGSGASTGVSAGGELPFFSGGVGFATGGSFMVPGSGGTDQTPVGFWATAGEKVTIETPSQARRGAARGGDTYFIDARNSDAAGYARLEAMLRATGARVSRIETGFKAGVMATMVDARGRGGQVAKAFGS